MVDIQWMIGGEAGYGIMTTGLMMGKVFTRLGLSVFDYVEYPSLIRGGHNAYYVRAASQNITSQKQPIDILVCLNRETIDQHKDELSHGAFVMYDPNQTKVAEDEFRKDVQLVPVPFLELVRSVGATKLMINTLSLGASMALFSQDFTVMEKIMHDFFDAKGEKVVAENIKTAKAGFDYVKNITHLKPFTVTKKTQEAVLMGGAEAVAYGAIRAGVQFAAIYPMTPINGIMLTLTQHALTYGIITKEPEDEIAGINMAIGASYAGARSLVATSGGGFSLMVEALGLAAQTETPLVLIEGMRPGPATGMPTWTDQGDLRFVLHAAQGEFPRIVLAPGDVLEAFDYTMQAFNLADIYQLPVIVLVDKYLMEGHQTVNTDDLFEKQREFVVNKGKTMTADQAERETDYKRYELIGDGISPRSLPGQKGGISLSGSDEHDERGLYNEDGTMRINMMDKRFKKLELARNDVHPLNVYGSLDAELTIVLFGSTKLPVFEAQAWLKKEGIEIAIIQVVALSPFPVDLLKTTLQHAKQLMVIEGNKTGQLEGLIAEQTGITCAHRLRKYDGRPFYPEEIVAAVKEIL